MQMSIRIVTAVTFFVFSGVIARAAANSSSPHIPFSFVENRGQADPSVRYIGTGPEFKVWFKDHGVVLRHGRTTVKILFESGATAGHLAGMPFTTGRASSETAPGIRISAENPIGA